MGLAMDLDDLKFLQSHFRDEEKRDPTITEVRVVDTYWSDHCRHTTFSTPSTPWRLTPPGGPGGLPGLPGRPGGGPLGRKAAQRPQTLMDLATIGAKVLKKRGLLQDLDQTEEINACSIGVHRQVDEDGEDKPWLLLFKNETHNHPTEIEPFGGAATCLGGAIRDPLAGRCYVYQAMRVTGCGDPRTPVADTLSGKLPQRKLTTAAAGYSSYGNQIGLATGQVHELYHPGYAAKRMEIGAVVGAQPRRPTSSGRRPRPATWSSCWADAPGATAAAVRPAPPRATTEQVCGPPGSAEVQKGNAPEERKLQRLFRDARAVTRSSSAATTSARAACPWPSASWRRPAIDLSNVPKKYEGLDATELAITESQERMAVVVEAQDAERFIAGAPGGKTWSPPSWPPLPIPAAWSCAGTGKTVADLSRAFLDTNGAAKQAGRRPPSLPQARVHPRRPRSPTSRQGLLAWPGI